jgi:branched-chain amino acid transport system substrate-binding protein
MSACAPCDEDDTTNNGDNGAETGAAATETVEVGIIYSETGPLAAYEAQYRGGLEAGIDYATEGTVEVHGTTIELTYRDDTGNQDTALSTARDLIGQDYQILVGTVVSGIAVAGRAGRAERSALHLRTCRRRRGHRVNDYTFRSGRQSLQDVATAGSFLEGEDQSLPRWTHSEWIGPWSSATRWEHSWPWCWPTGTPSGSLPSSWSMAVCRCCRRRESVPTRSPRRSSGPRLTGWR